MAIAVALGGGLGVIHSNQTPESQAEMIQSTKRFVRGFVLDPLTLDPDVEVAALRQIVRDRGIKTALITEDGKLGSKLLGIVSARDFENCEDPRTALSAVMVAPVVTAQEPISLKEAQDRLMYTKVGKLPIVDDQQRVMSMVTREDIKTLQNFPNASLDRHGQLLVGAFISLERDRARAVVEAGADVLFVDLSIGVLDEYVEFIKELKKDYPAVQIVVGRVSSCRSAKRVADAGADAIIVGSLAPQLSFGGEVGAASRAEATLVYMIAKYIKLHFNDIPIIADGGLRSGNQILKAFCLGASGIILSDALLGTDEALGLGLGGDGASLESSVPMYIGRCGRAIESIGPVRPLIEYIEATVKHGMQDLGVQNVEDLHGALTRGDLRIECRCSFSTQVGDARKQAVQLSVHPEVLPSLPEVSTGRATLY
jgi:IMP dehydrogenase